MALWLDGSELGVFLICPRRTPPLKPPCFIFLSNGRLRAHTLLCLQVEKLARTLFLWKIEVHDQKERVYEMRRWNEALVTNMLPEHVARHFLGSKKQDEVRLCVFRTWLCRGAPLTPGLLVAWRWVPPQTSGREPRFSVRPRSGRRSLSPLPAVTSPAGRFPQLTPRLPSTLSHSGCYGE